MIANIGIFGRCNAGKSTLMNFITGADVSIVAPQSGTTTDPVRKRFELAGRGAVTFIDTAGIDDSSLLGSQRTARTARQAAQVDLAMVVFREWGDPEKELMELLCSHGTPVLKVFNGVSGTEVDIAVNLIEATSEQRDMILEAIREALPAAVAPKMFAGMVGYGDNVLLVCPIDAGAPEGRMILPQVQALREILDAGAIGHVVQPAQLRQILESGMKFRMVVADSQVYKEVRAAVPAETEVTTFSILLGAAKGDYGLYTEGLEALRRLKSGQSVLVAEFCAHQGSCDDIARVKIPRWMEEYVGGNLSFTYISPAEPFPVDAGYSLMIVCGGCMATRRQVQARLAEARLAGVAATNFGMLIREIR